LYLIFAREIRQRLLMKLNSYSPRIFHQFLSEWQSLNLFNPSAFNLREFAIPFEADAEHVHTQVFPFIAIARAGIQYSFMQRFLTHKTRHAIFPIAQQIVYV
jgi:hypothetical protein